MYGLGEILKYAKEQAKRENEEVAVFVHQTQGYHNVPLRYVAYGLISEVVHIVCIVTPEGAIIRRSDTAER